MAAAKASIRTSGLSNWLKQQPQCRQPWRIRDAVRANGGQLRLCLPRCEAARPRAELRRHGVGIKGPIGSFKGGSGHRALG